VLGNLVANARRHAETGVEVFVSSAGGRAVVAVCDDGAGIAPADRDRVFERFVRLADGRRRDSSGSGLGLPISRDIAQSHGGTLEIEDSPRGARFVLRLPHSDRQASECGAPAALPQVEPQPVRYLNDGPEDAGIAPSVRAARSRGAAATR
jgi:signal transduction histidine kinase